MPTAVSVRDVELARWERFRAMMAEVVASNPFWKSKLGRLAVDPRNVASWEEFRQLPFSTKHEFVADQLAHPPYGSNLTYPLVRYCRYHQTSGTTGHPMRWLDTSESWDWFMECWRQIYDAVGLTADDVLAFPFSFGPFIGFWAAFEGAIRLGRRCLPLGGLGSEPRLKILLDNNATIVCCTPTYALRLAETAESRGIDLPSSSVRALLVAGEPGGNIPAVRQRLESAWGARVFDHWGMTDIGSLGIEPVDGPCALELLATECIPEVVHPETGEPAATGETGELVITNLGRWGQPVIRYRTGDLVQVAPDDEQTSPNRLRLAGGILGRADDMVTIRGNNVFPSSIEAILREFPDIVEFRITLSERRSMHHLAIEIEPTAELVVSPSAAEELLNRVNTAFHDRLHFHADVSLVAPESLPRFEMKGKRFVRQC
jgi:phenylacetate-CoA ligase